MSMHILNTESGRTIEVLHDRAGTFTVKTWAAPKEKHWRGTTINHREPLRSSTFPTQREAESYAVLQAKNADLLAKQGFI